MIRLNTAINVIARIVDAVVYPVYLLYAAMLFRIVGLEEAPEHRTGRIVDGHTAKLVESRSS